MEMRLEVVPLPVSDIDRATEFHVERVGFQLDHDVRPSDGVRVVQLTPPGSSCSIVLSSGLPGMSSEAGSTQGLHLIVGAVADLGGRVRMAGFVDPDGNSWALQELGR